MRPVVIQNPILNSPYTEPTKHWRFTNDQITDTVDAGRRSSSYSDLPQEKWSRS